MTLRFFNNKNKPDARQVDFEKAMVELGLEKAALEREVGKVRGEIDQLGKRREDFDIEIEGKKKELVGYDQKLNAIRQEIADALKSNSARSVELKDREDEALKAVEDRESEISKLEEHSASLSKDIDEKNEKLAKLQQDILSLQESLATVVAELTETKRQLENVREDVQEAYRAKADALKILEEAQKELSEVEAILESLKRNNRGGLDAVASLEAERKRLQEKDDFLRRKEADLLVYENRIAKRADELGIKMTFK